MIAARKTEFNVSAIYFNSLSARIFMISYLESEGESVWQDSPL